MKHATASYLEPKLNPNEIVEILRNHYPIHIQRVMLSSQLHSIEDALDLLKRVKVMEQNESSQRTHQQAPYHNPNPPRQNQASPRDARFQNLCPALFSSCSISFGLVEK
jgi:hypothetical protein